MGGSGSTFLSLELAINSARYDQPKYAQLASNDFMDHTQNILRKLFQIFCLENKSVFHPKQGLTSKKASAIRVLPEVFYTVAKVHPSIMRSSCGIFFLNLAICILRVVQMVRSRKNPENNAIHVNLHMGRMLEKYLFMQRNLGAFQP